MSEFKIGTDTFRIGKLNAFQQFHLSRKIAPIIPTMLPLFSRLQSAAGEGVSNPLTGDLGMLGELMQPFADGIAGMPDESAEFILSTCLGAVKRQQGNSWFDVWNASQNVCMFDDIDLGVMIRLSVRVITESLGPFLRGMLTGQGTPKA